MAINRTAALKLLTATELDVFQASLAESLRTLDKAELRAKIRRSRALRDKFQDLLRRQRLATRARTGAKSGVGGEANERTLRKADAFAMVLQRFEKRLAQLEASEARAAKKSAGAQARLALARKKEALAAKAGRQVQLSPKAPAKGPVSGSKVGPTSESARAKSNAMQMKAAGNQAVQGHVSSQIRRSQAKRDSRG